jgi:methylmalonyl-CoA mutase N-terminal domain/subunit
VGLNEYIDQDEKIEIPILEIEKEVEKQQVRRLKKLKETRDNQKVLATLKSLKQAAASDKNLMPELINCAKAYASLGEMINVLKDVFGEYVESTEF